MAFDLNRNSDLAIRTISGIVMILVALGCLWIGGWLFTAFAVIVGILSLREWNGLAHSPSLNIFGILYIALATASLIALRDAPSGFALTLWTLAIVWATDIGAYFFGRSIGGPKLAPAISPAKTWSGLIGGAVTAAIIGWLIATRAGLPLPCLWLAAPLAVLAQMGDLFESWLKRRAGVKDSGKLLPGHGGVLDRIDGVIPVASAVALMLWIGLI